MRRALGAAALLPLLLLGCGDDGSDACPPGRPIERIRAADATTVEITFACRLDPDPAADPGRYAISVLSDGSGQRLGVSRAAPAGGGLVRLTTAPQTALQTYALRVTGLRDAAGGRIDASGNFVGVGQGGRARVSFRLDDRYNANLTAVSLLVSVDPLTGVFSHYESDLALADGDGDHVWTASLDVAIDPARTRSTRDDRQGARYMAYSARAVDRAGRPLSDLVLFEVADATPITVSVPLLSVPVTPPVEGRVKVTFSVDDRPARALSKPSLKASWDSDGKFDASFPSSVALTDKDGDDVWEGTAQVWIDPDRTLTGATASTQPYSVTLVESGTTYSARSADFVVPEEKAVKVSILIGDPNKVPVTFQVDASAAWLDTAGARKGLYTDEALFLTGEFGTAEDAFGQNAADAFSGGENVVLQMVQRADHPGVWTRTLFLPRSATARPYGWKVVRCPKDKGCTALNKMVSSSGRAFPTVMKNLVTELCDTGKTQWTDPNCKSPKIIDPRSLSKVDTGAGTLDYSAAAIWAGTGSGLADQQDPAGTPKASLMFKQEVPDLAVSVKDKAVTTPVYVVGTWRDVNIPGPPSDIINGGTVLDLGQTDNDAGQSGSLGPTYTLAPPARPSPFKMDGQVDAAAVLVAGGAKGNGVMPLYLALSGDHLYLATDDAGEGSDNFILLSTTKPGAARPAPWGKAGKVAMGGKTLFLADEDENNFAGWFELGAGSAGADKQLEALGSDQSAALAVYAPATNGGALEGSVDLRATFGAVPKTVYVACAPWLSADKGALYHAAQTPATRDGDGDIDADEILAVSLSSLKASP